MDRYDVIAERTILGHPLPVGTSNALDAGVTASSSTADFTPSQSPLSISSFGERISPSSPLAAHESYIYIKRIGLVGV
jgi:hypothetical protein